MEIKFLPQKIDNPFIRSDTLIIPEKDIPKEFRVYSSNKWVKLFEDMFFRGIQLTKVIPKEGIDKDLALRHIRVVASSWDCSHEHKTACCAYLFFLWFDDIQYKVTGE